MCLHHCIEARDQQVSKGHCTQRPLPRLAGVHYRSSSHDEDLEGNLAVDRKPVKHILHLTIWEFGQVSSTVVDGLKLLYLEFWQALKDRVIVSICKSLYLYTLFTSIQTSNTPVINLPHHLVLGAKPTFISNYICQGHTVSWRSSFFTPMYKSSIVKVSKQANQMSEKPALII